MNKMCGIGAISFKSTQNLKSLIYSLLAAMQQDGRGTHGAGYCYYDRNSKQMVLAKDTELYNLINNDNNNVFSDNAILHVRMASVGSVSQKNAHPFVHNSKLVAICGNGTMTFHSRYKDDKYEYTSDTDTETILTVITNNINFNNNYSYKAISKKLTKLNEKHEFDHNLAILTNNYIVIAKFGYNSLYLYNVPKGYIVTTSKIAFLSLSKRTEITEGEIIFLRKGKMIYKYKQKTRTKASTSKLTYYQNAYYKSSYYKSYFNNGTSNIKHCENCKYYIYYPELPLHYCTLKDTYLTNNRTCNKFEQANDIKTEYNYFGGDQGITCKHCKYYDYNNDEHYCKLTKKKMSNIRVCNKFTLRTILKNTLIDEEIDEGDDDICRKCIYYNNDDFCEFYQETIDLLKEIEFRNDKITECSVFESINENNNENDDDNKDICNNCYYYDDEHHYCDFFLQNLEIVRKIEFGNDDIQKCDAFKSIDNFKRFWRV